MKRYFPKQLFQLIKQNPIEGKKLYWRQSDPYTYTLSMCLYYEGGQWRHITTRFDIRDLSFHIGSVFYENHAVNPEGNEITRAQWDNLGYSISSGTKAFSEIIPPNDPEALEWLESKGIVIEVTHQENMSQLQSKTHYFLGLLRQTLEEASKSEAAKNMYLSTIEEVGITRNVNMLKEFFEKNPNSRIWNSDFADYSSLYSITKIKNSNQINPKHIKQIKSLFFGDINVDTF